MSKYKNNATFAILYDSCAEKSDSLLPHIDQKQPAKAVFGLHGHKIDTKITSFLSKMRPPSKPKINKTKESTWFIEWNHDVPVSLWTKYKRKRIRIKIYDEINRFKGLEREKYANERLKVWDYLLFKESYNPFLAELTEQRVILTRHAVLDEKIESAQAAIQDDSRTSFTIKKALECFIHSRIERKVDAKSIVSYQGTCDWFLSGLAETNNDQYSISKLKHIHITAALNFTANKRSWSATTINKEVGFLMTIFNWLETEDYVLKNPSKNKFIPLKTKQNTHKWFDRDLAIIVKNEVVKSNKNALYRAMQFTYWLCIRSKDELRKLKIGDIDTDLHRIRFTSELSKNNREQFRPYPSEFSDIILEMKLSSYPSHFYVFGGKTGEPGENQCGHNFFSKQFKVIKDKLGLSNEYTIYGWKHTRLVHELMRGTELTEISYLARHTDFKTTEVYLRDFDINLKRVYEEKDLTF